MNNCESIMIYMRYKKNILIGKTKVKALFFSTSINTYHQGKIVQSFSLSTIRNSAENYMYEKVEIWDALCFKITVKLFDLLKKDKISSKKFRRASHAYI